MLKLSKKVEYGLMALLYVDAHRSSGVVSAKEISDAYALPADLLGKVMQSLARSGVIDAFHGARGGYRLTRDLNALSLGDVIEAIDGPVRLVQCQHEGDRCQQIPGCSLRAPIRELHAQLEDFLFNVSLSQFRKPLTADFAGGIV
jgi:Rrf2 family protein